MYFKAGGNASEIYDGPRDLISLMEFVNEKTCRGPPTVKVYSKMSLRYECTLKILNSFTISKKYMHCHMILQTESELLMEAGCKKKEWEIKDGIPYQYHWNSTGLLLATGVCIKDDYQKQFPPDDGITKVYSTIESHQVRAVDAKMKTLSIDFTLTMRWLDSRIKTNFIDKQNEIGEVLLGTEATHNIWYPDLHVWNRQSFKIK